MKQPILYVFAISHFCEKARWALDRSDIDYKLKFLAPGVHIQKAKKLGLPKSAVPILALENETIQGSDKIIDWVDAHIANPALNLTPTSATKQIEKRLDDKIGIHSRRYFYSEAIVEFPETVKPIFKKGIPFHHKILIDSIWPKVCKLMIKGMDLGPDQHLESKAIIENELDWLDDLLTDGRAFLSGDQFSRADLAAASLLSPLVSPAQHPTYAKLSLPPGVARDAEGWKNRPILKWVNGIYRDYR
jgi:glutathione S-transferase